MIRNSYLHALKNIKIQDIISIMLISLTLIGIKSTVTNYLGVGLSVLFFIILIFEKKNSWKILLQKSLLYFFLFLSYVFFTGLLSGNILTSLKHTTALFANHSSLILFFYYFENEQIKKLKAFTIYSVVLISFFSLRSVILFSVNGNLPIKLAQNTGGNYYFVGEVYGLTIACGILIPVFISLLLNAKKWSAISKLALFASCSIMFLAIYKSRSSLTLFITFFLSIITIFIGNSVQFKNTKKIKLFIAFILTFILVIVLGFYKNEFSDLIISISKLQNSKLFLRIREIGETLKNNGFTQELQDENSRIALLSGSLNVFKQFPLWGSNHITVGDFFKIKQLGIGMHNTLFDTFAMYGLAGSSLYIMAMIESAKNALKNKSIYPIWISSIVLFALVNPYVEYTVMHVQFFIIPTLYIMVKEKNDENICCALRVSK